MTDERIDEILGKEEELVPSSGFLSSVMDRVREEAAIPPPIPIPWRHAVPGFIVVAIVFSWAAVQFGRALATETVGLTLQPVRLPAAAVEPLEQAGWVIAALAFSVGSWLLSRRLAR